MNAPHIDIDWNAALLDQPEWHWLRQLRPRLEGLRDEEYFWEPAEGSWNVRRRGESAAPMAAGSGDFTIDFAIPEPEPPPVTTIAWRLGHVVVGVLGMRNASHFGGPPMDYQSFGYAGTAAEALDSWTTGTGLGPTACAAWGNAGWRHRAVFPRVRSPSTRWLLSCCTSTARSSTTAPRSRCCATCTPPPGPRCSRSTRWLLGPVTAVPGERKAGGCALASGQPPGR